MNFLFYQQILNQSDLQDVAQTILSPLHTLNALNDKLNSLSVEEKHNPKFTEVSIKVENLIHKHFPTLVDNYSKLDFEYRNTVIIKKEENQGYTAKEIFLKNIGKLIEDIQIVSHEFNNNYSHELLVQNRIFNNLGLQKNIFLAENQLEHIKPVIIENNFDYNNFKQLNPQVFIKPEINIKSLEDKKIVNSDKDIILKTKQKNHNRLFNTLCVAGISSLFVLCFVNSFNMLDNSNRVNHTLGSVWKIINGSQFLYVDQANYKGLNENIVSQARLTDQIDGLVTGYNTTINVSDTTIMQPYDSIKVTLNDMPQESCSVLTEKLAQMNIDKVKVNNHLLVNDGMVDLVNVEKVCSLPKNQFIIEQTENLLRKNTVNELSMRNEV